MESERSIGATRRQRKKGRPPTRGSFGSRGRPGGDPAKAAAARWSQDRRNIVAVCAELTPVTVEMLREVVTNPRAKDADRLRAGEIILSYGHGRPSQQIDLNVNGPRSVATLSTVELEAIACGAPPPCQLEHHGTVIEAEIFKAPAVRVNVSNGAKAMAGSVPRSVQDGIPRE